MELISQVWPSQQFRAIPQPSQSPYPLCAIMVRSLLFGFLFLNLASCSEDHQLSKPDPAFSIKFPKASSIRLFGDSSYVLSLQTFDTTNSSDPEIKNSVLTFSKIEEDNITVFFRDSIFCMHHDIELQDFNNDKIKDVLIFYYSGGRANPSYHLYLTNIKEKKLIRVNGFEELPNPDFDTSKNIITSIALAGTNSYSFYRISSDNTLNNLGHEYEENHNDSLQYENAIRQIINNNK